MKHRAVYGGMIVFLCMLWGLGNPIIKVAGHSIAPFASIALRFSLAFLVFMVFFGRRVLRNLRTVKWPQTIAVCIFTALAFTLGSFALMLTEAMIAGFLISIAVLFTPFLEPIILRTRFNWRILPIVLIVCVGMYLLCGGGAFSFGLGELLAVLCSISYAIMLTLSEKYIGNIDTVTLSTLQCATAAILSIACMLIFEGVFDPRTLTWEGVGAIAYLSLASTCAAYVLQNKALRHIPATFASLIFCTEPVFTVFFSYLLLGETLDLMGVIGAAIILAGVMYASVMRPQGNADIAFSQNPD
ncbi:DMT family transporter [Eubacteriales bacterium OttesenSCG-928-A19]|nr:DMT family transporter [Eubacteriales bacterium OttesenSCG-928-A19]